MCFCFTALSLESTSTFSLSNFHCYENQMCLYSLTALEQPAGELPGTIKEGDFLIKCRDKCLVWEYSGNCGFPETVPAKPR